MEEVFFYHRNRAKWKIEWNGMSLIPNDIKMTPLFCNSILVVCLILFYPTVKILEKIHSPKRPNLHMVWNLTGNRKGLMIFFKYVSDFGIKRFQVIRLKSKWATGQKVLVNYSSELINEVTVLPLGIIKRNQDPFSYPTTYV